MEIQDFIGKAHGGEKILTGSYLKLPTKVGSYDIFFVEPLYKICTGLRGVLQEKNHPKECSVFASFAFFANYMCNKSLPAKLTFLRLHLHRGSTGAGFALVMYQSQHFAIHYP